MRVLHNLIAQNPKRVAHVTWGYAVEHSATCSIARRVVSTLLTTRKATRTNPAKPAKSNCSTCMLTALNLALLSHVNTNTACRRSEEWERHIAAPTSDCQTGTAVPQSPGRSRSVSLCSKPEHVVCCVGTSVRQTWRIELTKHAFTIRKSCAHECVELHTCHRRRQAMWAHPTPSAAPLQTPRPSAVGESPTAVGKACRAVLLYTVEGCTQQVRAAKSSRTCTAPPTSVPSIKATIPTLLTNCMQNIAIPGSVVCTRCMRHNMVACVSTRSARHRQHTLHGAPPTANVRVSKSCRCNIRPASDHDCHHCISSFVNCITQHVKWELAVPTYHCGGHPALSQQEVTGVAVCHSNKPQHEKACKANARCERHAEVPC